MSLITGDICHVLFMSMRHFEEIFWVYNTLDEIDIITHHHN